MQWNFVLRILRKIKPELHIIEFSLSVILWFTIVSFLGIVLPESINIPDLLAIVLMLLMFFGCFLIFSGLTDYIRDYDKPELMEDDILRIQQKCNEIRQNSITPLDGDIQAIEWRKYEELKYKKDPDNNWEDFL